MSMPKAITSAIIAGGDNNELTGNHSAILGGQNNSDGGFSCVGIYGNGITATFNNTFIACNYIVRNMPSFSIVPGQLNRPLPGAQVCIS